MHAVAADAKGNVIASGMLSGAADLGTGPLAPFGMNDLFVAGFASSGGATLFARRLGGADYETADAIGIGPGGEIALGGYFRGTADFGKGSTVGGTSNTGLVLLLSPP